MSRELLNRLRLPVVAAPMFLVSGPDMVIAAARAGIVGAFPTPNCRTTEQVDEWMTRIVAETADALGTSPMTVKRRWTLARAWLYERLADAPVLA